MSIEVNGLHFSYGKGKKRLTILKDVTFSVGKGEFVGIIGNVGCGKTTLIKHLNGLLVPLSGNVTVDGFASSKKEVCRKVGVLFQQPSKQLFCKTVFEDIAYGPSNFGMKGDELEHCVHDAIEKVGLSSDILGSSPFSLSGGEMRLVALAGVLSSSPDYLVLDEPTSGLSTFYKERLFKTLELLRQNGVGIVLVSHHLEDVLGVADKIVYLTEGKMVFEGTPEEYLSSLSLPAPEITVLMRELSSSGLAVKKTVFSVEDAFNEIVGALSEKRG